MGLFLSAILFGQTDSLKQTSFPESWDQNNVLRGERGEVLIWGKFKSNFDDRIIKKCVLIETHLDTTGNYYFVISEKSSVVPFERWSVSTIHRHPSKEVKNPDPRVYTIKRTLTTYEPIEKSDIKKLFGIGSYYFSFDDYTLVEAGIDNKLWYQLFGIKPTDEEFESFIERMK